jgi:hypothetical protein
MTTEEAEKVLAADKVRREKQAAYQRTYHANRKKLRDAALEHAGIPIPRRGAKAKVCFSVKSVAAGAEARLYSATSLSQMFSPAFAAKVIRALRVNMGSPIIVEGFEVTKTV